MSILYDYIIQILVSTCYCGQLQNYYQIQTKKTIKTAKVIGLQAGSENGKPSSLVKTIVKRRPIVKRPIKQVKIYLQTMVTQKVRRISPYSFFATHVQFPLSDKTASSNRSTNMEFFPKVRIYNMKYTCNTILIYNYETRSHTI